MAIKKLYTENYIRNIADGIRVVLDNSASYYPAEMGPVIASIHQGAKEVWIGDQMTYNLIPTYELDPEICYIILESGKIRRCYAGTVIIYEELIDWDFEVYNKTVGVSEMIDTGINITPSDIDEAKSLGWEYILKSDGWIDPDYPEGGGEIAWQSPYRLCAFADPVYQPDILGTGEWVWCAFDRYTSPNQNSTFNIQSDISDPWSKIYYRAKHLPNEESINIYKINPDTNEESFYINLPINNRMLVNNNITLGNTGRWSRACYKLKSFQFRWLTEDD